jgi:hypothetical protein
MYVLVYVYFNAIFIALYILYGIQDESVGVLLEGCIMMGVGTLYCNPLALYFVLVCLASVCMFCESPWFCSLVLVYSI